jgi:hypothetical protein
MKFIKKLIYSFVLIFFSSSVLTSSAQQQVKNFSEMMTALKEGRQIHVVIHYAKCKLLVDSTEEESPNAIGGMQLKTWEYFAQNVIGNPKAFVISSETVLISHWKRGYVYNYVKIKLNEDNKVEVTARYLLPSTLEVVMNETFYGEISNGNDNNAIFLFYED